MADKKQSSPKRTFGMIFREYADTLLYAFILAMLIRTFVAEPYVIPSGSMTPTLLGNYCGYYDYDGDGDKDLVVQGSNGMIEVFFRENGNYTGKAEFVRVPFDRMQLKDIRDKIIVTKFNYWFKLPRRGDIAIFKVPKIEGKPWDKEKPIYIKRVTGLPGEHLAIRDGKIYINNEPVGKPSSLAKFYYLNVPGFYEANIPENHIFVCGDNSASSYDSRYWGPLSIANLRGRAFFRFLPFDRAGFLH